MSPSSYSGRKTVLVFQHVAHEGLGTIATALAAAGLLSETIEMGPDAPAFPRPNALAGLIVMGGPLGVYDQGRFPFLRREIDYIGRVIEADRPVLGVCLGAQLMAAALGAAVYPNKKKEIGWFPLRLTAAAARDPLMKKSPRAPWVFQWHGDTFDLPRGARRLAGSALCKNQAFRFKKNVYGLQYHLEVDEDMVRDWLAQPGAAAECAAVGPGTVEKIKINLTRRVRALSPLAHEFFSGFARKLKEAPIDSKVLRNQKN